MTNREKVLLTLVVLMFIAGIVGITWFIAKRGASSSADAPALPSTANTNTQPVPTQSATPTASDSDEKSFTLILQPGYNLKSLPYILSPNDGKTVLLGLSNREAYYLNSEKQWVSLYDSGTISPGQGVWIKSDRGEAYQPPVSAKAVDQTKPFTIKLTKGWNAVGNPFNKEITWDPAVKASKGTTTYKKAIEAKIITVAYKSNPVSKEYEPVNPGDKAAPFSGMLIKAGGDLELIISP